MQQHNDLWYTIGGNVLSIEELIPNNKFPSTPLHAIDSYYGTEIFNNPWGDGSQIALARALDCAEQRASQRSQQQVSLLRAVEVIEELQLHLENEVEKKMDSLMIRRYIELKGIPLAEVEESIIVLRDLVNDLKADREHLKLMLGTEDPQHFFSNHDIIPKFGLVASGNLGLFETTFLIWSGILAQAARNGNQFSLTIKPSMYDFLFHEMIQLLPGDIKSAFSRITWRSENDIIPDSSLMKVLVNRVDGAIYFGNRKTLIRFQELVPGNEQNHHFYYDHFPILIVLPGLGKEAVEKSAKLATTLAYRQRGESCLSLQDVFIHEDVYRDFVGYLIHESRIIQRRKTNPRDQRSLLSQYSKTHLEEIARLRQKLKGSVIGQVYPQDFRTDIIVNHDINLDDWVLATENAAPLLCLVEFSDINELLLHLRTHLRNSTSDKFIYSILVSSGNSEMASVLHDGLTPISHRIKILTSLEDINNFVTYKPGIPHCSGISFLADMFGIPHLENCYVGG